MLFLTYQIFVKGDTMLKLKENKSDEFNDIMDMVYLKANHDMNNSYQGGF